LEELLEMEQSIWKGTKQNLKYLIIDLCKENLISVQLLLAI